MKLSNIGRSLGEEIPLKKTENRLSRHINEGDLTKFLGTKLSQEDRWWIKEETVLALHLSDISKEQSKKAGVFSSGKKWKVKGKDTEGILDRRDLRS